MQRRALISSLCSSILRHPFYPSLKPISLFSLNHLNSNLTQSNSFCVSPQKPKFSSIHIPNYLFFFQSKLSNGPKFLTQFRNFNNFRLYSSESEYDFDQNREVDEINLKFAEARDDIEMALESRETIYFNEEAECARGSVKEVLNMFEALLAKLNEKDRAALQRSMGLKIEQLKAELEQLND